MAITAVTERGSSTEKVSDTTHAVSPSAAITVGKIAWLYGITDNTTLVTGASTDHTTVTDTDGHTWTKIFERTQSSAGVAADGVTHSLWFTKVTTEIGTGDSITLTIGTARTAKVLMVFENAVTAGSTVQAAASGSAFQEANTNTVSVALAGLPSKEYLLLGCAAREDVDTTWTEDADYTNVFASEGVATTGGGATTNVSGFLGSRIATLTGDTFAPTLFAAGSRSAALIAIEEVAGAGDQTLTGTLFTSTPTFPQGALTQSPAAPANLVATGTGLTTVDVAWDDVANETGFRIERSPNGTTGWVTAGTNAADDLTFTDTGRTCGTTYFYRVFATNASGDSAASNTDSAVTDACPPPPPNTGGNRMGGSGAVRKPPRHVGR